MTCVGDYEVNPLIYKKSKEKQMYMCTNGMLEMGVLYTKIFNLMLVPLHI